MKRYFNLAAICAAFVLSVAMYASAGSTDNFSGPLIGAFWRQRNQDRSHLISKQTRSPTSSSHLLAAPSENVNTSNGGGQATCANGFCGIYWQTTVGGDTIWDGIIINMATGQFEDLGYIFNSKNYGGFNYMSAPEGGSRLAYLLMSAAAVFGAIFVSGKYRRPIPTA